MQSVLTLSLIYDSSLFYDWLMARYQLRIIIIIIIKGNFIFNLNRVVCVWQVICYFATTKLTRFVLREFQFSRLIIWQQHFPCSCICAHPLVIYLIVDTMYNIYYLLIIFVYGLIYSVFAKSSTVVCLARHCEMHFCKYSLLFKTYLKLPSLV